MKNLIISIILIGICNYAQSIYSDELLELNCYNDAQCKQFQRSGFKVLCIADQCQCWTEKGETVKCQPAVSKVNNIIGGVCPCKQYHAVCDTAQDVCYCDKDFMPSSDKRRCIPKMVALDGKCEQESQCQRVDVNAICHESKECKCMDHFFVDDEGKCSSMIGNKSSSLNDNECHKQYGNNTKYSQEHQHCICKSGYFASADNSKCLKTAQYFERCIENVQCVNTMGPGGICMENVCQCSAKYFVEDKKLQDGTTRTVCTPVVERGDYCRHNDDCYQRQLNETEQSMDCVYGECNCKKGFYSLNDGACMRGSSAGIKSLMGLPTMLALLLFLNKYYS